MRLIKFEANPNKYRQISKTTHDTLAIERKKERNTIYKPKSAYATS